MNAKIKTEKKSVQVEYAKNLQHSTIEFVFVSLYSRASSRVQILYMQIYARFKSMLNADPYTPYRISTSIEKIIECTNREKISH